MENNEAKQKAKELIEWFMPRMYCYMGSGMLSNTYDSKVELENAKQCAIKLCDELIKNSYFNDELKTLRHKGYLYVNPEMDCKEFHEQVKKEIENYEQ